jgi:cysteine desulfurase/selenocysteine lyase
MSTPESPIALPTHEIVLATVGPAPLAASAPNASSPGVGFGAARSPTAPTVPDADPASLLLAVSRIANELFAAPPIAPASPPDAPTTLATPGAAPSPIPSAEAPSAPVGAPASPVATTTPAPSPPAPAWPGSAAGGLNPFLAPLDLDALFAARGDRPDVPSFEADAWRVPLVDAPAAEEAAPPAPHEPALLATPPFQIEPVIDPSLSAARGGFDARAIKAEFPILAERVHGRPLVWLDNAATTQKPRAVIDRLKTFYERENSNIHRAAHALAARATDAYEAARESVRRFVNAGSVRDVVFVRGTTEGVNLVAQTFGRRHVGQGDEIVLTQLEHHANIVPWQLLAAEKGARLRVAPVDDDGQIRLDEFEKLLGDRTKLVALPQVSNALGTRSRPRRR